MKVLLLNSPVQFNSWQNLEMPLGIAYIAAELERRGHDVSVRDYEVEHFDKTDLQDLLNRIKPDITGISFRSSSYASAKRIFSTIKEVSSDMKIALGGHHATAFPEETLKDMEADFIIRGEGEYAMAELLDALNGKVAFEKIKGLTYKKAGQVISNESSELIENLDALGFPAWHLFPIEKYAIGSILTSRGCPFSCIYCDKGVSTRKVRFRSPQNIYQEIKAFEEKYKKRRLYFVDDYFLLHKNRLSEIFALLINDEHLKLKWYCQARVDGIDKEILTNAKKSGCYMIIFGIESGDKAELEYMNKKATLEQAEEAVRLTREAGIKARANFMIGFPISTHATISNSLRFARKIKADLYRFFIVSPLPNTILWERLEKLYPNLADAGWDKFDFYRPSFDTVDLKKEELVTYVMAAYLYVLWNKVIRELTIEFIPRLVKLLFFALPKGRLRGNLSVAFPGSVNLFLEEWFIIRHSGRSEKIKLIKEMFCLASRIK